MLTIIEQRLLKKIHSSIESSRKNLTVLYFGYGANSSPKFLAKRLKHFEVVGDGILKNYELSFNTPCEYLGKGYGGITPLHNSNVYGTIYRISTEALALLDVLEWVKYGFYHRETLQIGLIQVEVYVPTNPRENLLPSKQYLEFLVSGATEMKQPVEYLEFLKSHPYKESFALDHNFNLRNPSSPRFFPASLCVLHDRLREKLCTLI